MYAQVLAAAGVEVLVSNDTTVLGIGLSAVVQVRCGPSISGFARLYRAETKAMFLPLIFTGSRSSRKNTEGTDFAQISLAAVKAAKQYDSIKFGVLSPLRSHYLQTASTPRLNWAWRTDAYVCESVARNTGQTAKSF